LPQFSQFQSQVVSNISRKVQETWSLYRRLKEINMRLIEWSFPSVNFEIFADIDPLETFFRETVSAKS